MSGRRVRLVAAVALLATACGTTPGPVAVGATRVTALVGGRVQPSPEASVIPDGVVLIEDATIAAVGARGDVRIPSGATIIDCAGGTVTAGFWNSHVHFLGPVWADPATAPVQQLGDALRKMLTSYGVVRVLDTGSIPGIVDAVLGGGADGIKLFTGSWATRRSIVVMPVELVRAATETAHRRGKFVIAHPSNSAGARAAIEGGVDILAHTFPTELDRRPWDRTLPGMMIERRMALVPTLKLFPYELRKLGLPPPVAETVLGNAQAQLRAFADAGGQVLFGTDVGYMTDDDPTDEYVFMQHAGLSYAQVLAALTTAPAARFGAAASAGRLGRGYAADIVVIDGDPARDIRALGKVRYTVRGGRVLYRARS